MQPNAPVTSVAMMPVFSSLRGLCAADFYTL